MAAAIGVRGDYDAARLRELAKRSEDANQTRRLLALAAIYDGGSRGDAARIGGVWGANGGGWGRAVHPPGPGGPGEGTGPRHPPPPSPPPPPATLLDIAC